MHVLITTRRTLGDRPDDFDHTVPGELVRLPTVECTDPSCGCDRGFIGLASARACTAAEVTNRSDLTPLDLWSLLLDDLTRALPAPLVQPEDLVLLIADLLALARIAGSLPVGTVIGRAGPDIAIRAHGPLPIRSG